MSIIKRTHYTRDDITAFDTRRPWSGFYSIQETDYSYPRFDGRQSERIVRATYVTGEAVNVLPYDPVHDRVLLIEQFRLAAHVAGDEHPWKIECVAGRIDPGEAPADCAHRETHEETGLTLNRLLPAASYYPQVGGTTTFFHAYVGLADLSDVTQSHRGLEDEAEDIRTHVIGYDEAMSMLSEGLLDNGPLILLLLWLGSQRASLRKGA